MEQDEYVHGVLPGVGTDATLDNHNAVLVVDYGKIS